MIRDIGVHLTGSVEDETRIAHAAAIARIFDAHLTGLHVHELPEILSITDPSGSAFLGELIEQSTRQAEVVGERLAARFAALGLNHELRRLDVYPGQVGSRLSSEARLSDLFVGTRPYGGPAGQQWIEEAVLFQSGRPCLFVPPSHQPAAEYGTILVAWKNTREAARAISEAMPFLQKAKTVIVGLVDEQGSPERRGEAPDEDIGRYLSRHGIKAEIHVIDGWKDAGAALLNEAVRTAADLIVMGAYGHSRFREWVLGGASRHILEHAEVPVLVAH